MNRLHHLKETLQKNIRDNDDYDNIEFIVLDYNSTDGMEEWVKENLSDYISSGKMSYYRVDEPQNWNPSHSKNIAFKLATGDILCNIWADYYAGKDFAHYTNNEFGKDKNIVLTPIDFHKTKPGFYAPPDSLGRVCVTKDAFLKVGGFDERMDRHGFEDYDFINRLEFAGVKRVLIDDFSYLGYVGHSDAERYNVVEPDSFDVFANYITPWMSECIILHKNQRFEKAMVLDESTIDATDYHYAFHPRNNRFTYSLRDGKWETGNWRQTRNQRLVFDAEQGKKPIYQKDVQQNKNVLIEKNSDKIFYHITDREVIKGLMTFKHFYNTRSLMEENLKKKIIKANSQHFGKAVVYKNFASQPIQI
jgi:hypothetical protein